MTQSKVPTPEQAESWAKMIDDKVRQLESYVSNNSDSDPSLRASSKPHIDKWKSLAAFLRSEAMPTGDCILFKLLRVSREINVGEYFADRLDVYRVDEELNPADEASPVYRRIDLGGTG